MKNLYTSLAVAGILATALTLSACSPASPTGGGMSGMGSHSSEAPSSGTTASATDFNDADVSFATDMVMHHQQAVQMAQMILDKDGIDPKVTALAEKIKAAQEPEITTMNGWLTSWGKEHDMSSMNDMQSMPGTMSPDDMATLEAASGTTAASLFLTQMTAHHEGAITMAQEEIDSGANADAVALAKMIITDQTAEISQMKDLLASP